MSTTKSARWTGLAEELAALDSMDLSDADYDARRACIARRAMSYGCSLTELWSAS